MERFKLMRLLFLLMAVMLNVTTILNAEEGYVIRIEYLEQVSENELQFDLTLENTGGAFHLDHFQVVIDFNPAIRGEGFLHSEDGLFVIPGSSGLLHPPESTQFILNGDDRLLIGSGELAAKSPAQNVNKGSSLRLARLQIFVLYDGKLGTFGNVYPEFILNPIETKVFACLADKNGKKSGAAYELKNKNLQNLQNERPLAGHFYSGNGYWDADPGTKNAGWNTQNGTHPAFAGLPPTEHANAIIGGQIKVAAGQTVQLSANGEGHGGNLIIQDIKHSLFRLELVANGVGVDVMAINAQSWSIESNPSTTNKKGDEFNFFSSCLNNDCGSFINWKDQNETEIGTDEFFGIYRMPAAHMVITANWTSGSFDKEPREVNLLATAKGKGFSEGHLSEPDKRGAQPRLLVEAGASLQVEHLYASTDMGAEAILLQGCAGGTPSGRLIHNNEGVKATVEEHFNRYSQGRPQHGWHLVSSPVQEMPIRPEFIPYPPEGEMPDWVDFYKWDEAHQQEVDGETVFGWWINSKQGDSWNAGFEELFRTGTGYLFAYGGTGDRMHRFEGVLEVSDIPVNGLTYTAGGDYAGWHLLGNPFVTDISWSKGDWQRQNILGGPVIWQENYGSYSPAVDIIPAMQGFMLKTSGNGSLIIPAGARLIDEPDRRNDSGTIRHIRIAAHDPDRQTAQETVILFRPDATPGYDIHYDTPFVQGHAPQFYSLSDDQPLLLNNRPDLFEAQTIPLMFLADHTNEYHIGLKEVPEGVRLYLEDLQERQVYPLEDQGVLPFSQVDGQPRHFLLHLNPEGVPQPSACSGESLLAWAWQQTLFVHTGNDHTSVRLYNLYGQLLHRQTFSGQGLHSTELPGLSGIFIVRLEADDLVVVRRVVVSCEW